MSIFGLKTGFVIWTGPDKYRDEPVTFSPNYEVLVFDIQQKKENANQICILKFISDLDRILNHPSNLLIINLLCADIFVLGCFRAVYCLFFLKPLFNKPVSSAFSACKSFASNSSGSIVIIIL